MNSQDKQIVHKLTQKKNILVEKNKRLDALNTQIDSRNKLYLEKTKFIDRLETKINKLSQKTVLTQMKYSHYKWYYDFFNILIILISSILTILETIKNEVNYEEKNESVKYFFKLTPIVLSSIIIIISSILKFLRLQENLELMARTSEKSILTIYRMKKVQEESHFATIEELSSIQQMYLDEIFIMYNQCQADISKCFRFEDIIKYKNKLKFSILKGKEVSQNLKTKYNVNETTTDTNDSDSDSDCERESIYPSDNEEESDIFRSRDRNDVTNV